MAFFFSPPIQHGQSHQSIRLKIKKTGKSQRRAPVYFGRERRMVAVVVYINKNLGSR